MAREGWARITAGVIGAAVLLSLVPPLAKALGRGEGLFEAIWGLLRWFTITTNLLVGLVFTRLAWRGRDSVGPVLLGGTMLAIVLVGVVFNLLLPALPHQTLWDALGDRTHHVVAPIVVPLWWALFAHHGRLRWSATLAWAAYPLAYIAYSFARAAVSGPRAGSTSRYPYFFMDIDRFGVPTVALYLLAISTGFVLAGLLAVLTDRWLGGMGRD
ncbi:Pr6Pr family membrane protein [Novosphingobium sp.]|uniref:Pr6Pr family membrane protein n=1 Tax=Novosphingobium sp. TaxID=1874826 RepID=UPI00262665F6|nr:Pr6Pr family membrane protein [Novosphingobium sp.]